MIGLILSAHIWLTLRLFPSLASLFDDQPAISVDHAIHLYHGYLGAKFLKDHGTSWGYDPFFMAGYPKTPVYDSSSGPAELFQLLAGGVYSPRAYKIGIAVLVCLVPVVVGVAANSRGANPGAVAATMTMCAGYWWLGFPDVLVRTGLVAFVWSSALAVLLPALLLRWGQRPTWAGWSALALTATMGIQAHAIFALMSVVPTATAYGCLSCGKGQVEAGVRSRPGLAWHLWTFGGLALALALSSFWWRPLIQFLPLKTASETFMIYRGDPEKTPVGHMGDLAATYYLLADGRIPALMVLFGGLGLVSQWRAGRRLESCVLSTQIAVLSALTFVGSEWQPTRNLEPLRFQVPLGLAWSMAAGSGVAATLSGFTWFGSPRPRWLRLAGSLAMIILALLMVIPAIWWRFTPFRPDSCPLASFEFATHRLRAAQPLAIGLRPEMRELVDWIRTNTDDTSRILFEDQLRLLEQSNPSAPESLHWTPLLPLLTGRQFIGGLYHMAFIPHQCAAFGDWHLAGSHIRNWSPEELRSWCDRYNIGWVVTWSRASWLKQGPDRGNSLSTEVFAGLSFCEPVARIRRHTDRPDENEYTVFRVHHTRDFFERGRGRVERVDYNRIELVNLEPDAGELILRYHWVDQFVSDPPLSLEQMPEPGDPVGFIRIKTPEPVRRLVIRNAYSSKLKTAKSPKN